MAATSTENNPGEPGVARYVPAPRDTSGVALPDDVCALTELIARNTHEVWAGRRVAEGWRYGPRRDDARKEHPGLLPYEQLPDAEKEYDRGTVLETLRLIVSLGYRIEKTDMTGR